LILVPLVAHVAHSLDEHIIGLIRKNVRQDLKVMRTQRGDAALGSIRVKTNPGHHFHEFVPIIMLIDAAVDDL
jgi:hypothetical protein